MRARQRLRRYESLTKLRQRQEDMKAQVYATAQREVQVAIQERDQLELAQQALLNKTVVSKGDSINKQRQLALHRFERYTAQRIVEKDAVIQERTAISKDKHAELKGAMVLRKMMETLSSHARETIEKDWQLQERYSIDEIATQRANQPKRKP